MRRLYGTIFSNNALGFVFAGTPTMNGVLKMSAQNNLNYTFTDGVGTVARTLIFDTLDVVPTSYEFRSGSISFFSAIVY